MKEKFNEKIFRIIIKIATYITVLISLSIVITLLLGAIPFFEKYSIFSFLIGKVWTPNSGVFGVIPLLLGTIQVVFYSSLVAIPLGLLIAVYLSQYASKKIRNILKPILEILAGIPSIVYGFFAYNFINPIITDEPYSILGASIALGVMLIPMIASLSEDSLRAVPISLKEASLGLGATEFETIVQVLIPAGLSGIMASFILAMSRALGETMIVFLAAGGVASMSLNPLSPAMTMTGALVQSTGTDATLTSPEYTVLYAIGLVLFIFTLILNMVSKKITAKYQVKYN